MKKKRIVCEIVMPDGDDTLSQIEIWSEGAGEGRVPYYQAIFDPSVVKERPRIRILIDGATIPIILV